MSETPIRVVVADDHAVVREGIRCVLEQASGIAVVGEAASGRDALNAVSLHKPDVLVLDITMPDVTGLQVAARVREEFPDTRVLILTMHDHAEYALGALRAGADGYLLKSATPAEVRSAVRAVAGGSQQLALDARQFGSALRQEAAKQQSRERLDALTPREREVLALVAGGQTNREIAEALGISHRTVEVHRDHITRKLGIRTVAGLTRFALETGLLSS